MRQALRNGSKVRKVARDVLADAAIPTGCADFEQSIFVDEFDGRAVQLGFSDVFHVGVGAQTPLDPFVERKELGLVHRVVERQHRNPVRHRRETRARGEGTYATSGRVRPGEVGPARFEVEQLAAQAIVLGVGDLGAVVEVVEGVVAVDGGDEMFDAAAGGGSAGVALGSRQRDLPSPATHEPLVRGRLG